MSNSKKLNFEYLTTRKRIRSQVTIHCIFRVGHAPLHGLHHSKFILPLYTLVCAEMPTSIASSLDTRAASNSHCEQPFHYAYAKLRNHLKRLLRPLSSSGALSSRSAHATLPHTIFTQPLGHRLSRFPSSAFRTLIQVSTFSKPRHIFVSTITVTITTTTTINHNRNQNHNHNHDHPLSSSQPFISF